MCRLRVIALGHNDLRVPCVLSRTETGARWNSERFAIEPLNRVFVLLDSLASHAAPDRNRGANDDECDRNRNPEWRHVEQIRGEREPHDADDDGEYE